jgi:group I intron endonuclease
MLYKLSSAAVSLYGNNHTTEAIEKIKQRLIDPTNHSMFGKNHSPRIWSLISKPGKLNPMFGKTHKIETKIAMSNKKGKPVTLCDSNNSYVLTFFY